MPESPAPDETTDEPLLCLSLVRTVYNDVEVLLKTKTYKNYLNSFPFSASVLMTLKFNSVLM